MNILTFNWRDSENPAAGGAETFTHEVLQRLAERGHDVALFTSRFDGAAERTVVDGVEIIRAGNKYTVYRNAKKFYRRKDPDIDVVIDEINTRPFNTPRYVEEPVVALIHQLAGEFWHYEMPFPIDYVGRYLLEPYWLKQYTDIPTITVSDSTKRDLTALGFDDVTVVPEGVDVEPLDAVPDLENPYTLLFVGRLKRSKKPEEALKAFTLLEERVDLPLEMEVVGDGYLMDELRQTYEADNVTFHGHVTGAKKFALMEESHLLLVPGVREGWGLVVTEANAMGTPAVGYDIPGLRDSIKDGDTGLLADPTPESLATTAEQLLTDTDYRHTLSRNALDDARTFSWDETTDQIEQRLQGVVA